MGEFHYSRYPADYWEESLLKMKAGGIGIVSSYVFWIHHEEEKGKWDFSGQRDLGRFVKLCAKNDLLFWLRIGPWAHGECRNGGFPDWLQNDKTIKLRSDDPEYLDLVRILYGKIFEAVRGLLWKDGGPVIGIQLENEYGHCGGLRGEEGLNHMRTLKKFAVNAGFDVPYYSATGWGGAMVVDGEMLPVQGGYADAPWEPHTKELPANQNYLLAPFLNDPLIGSDYGSHDNDFSFNVKDNPYLTAELGGGIQVTTHRRPVISADDTASMALCKIATGANLLGYYMYHGGTNPEGKLSTLQETKATGSYTDVPVLSYDFQACIGEYGELHQSYRKLKRLHTFLNDFGELIAPSIPIFPENRIDDAEDISSMRYCVRHNFETNNGFLVVNNHQRNRKMAEHKEVVFTIKMPHKDIQFPAMNIPSGFFGIFPYNMQFGDRTLISTNAQLLCILNETIVFTCHEKPVFNYSSDPLEMILLTEDEADNAWLFEDKLYVTGADLYSDRQNLLLTAGKTMEEVTVFPEKKKIEINFDPVNIEITAAEISGNNSFIEYKLNINEIPQNKINDLFLEIDFSGDRAELYIGGKMIADWFTTGLPWRIGLRRFDYCRDYTLKIFPVTKDTYFENNPGKICSLNKSSLHAQYSRRIE